MKVLMIEHFGGDNLYGSALARALAEAAVDLTLISTNSALTSDGLYTLRRYYPAFEGRSKIQKLISYISGLARTFIAIIHGGYDIIHLQTMRFQSVEWLFWYVISYFSPKIVCTSHNILPHERSGFHQFIYRKLYKRAAGIIVHNEYSREKILEFFPEACEKLSVVPHGNYMIFNSPMVKTGNGSAKNRRGIASKNLLMFGVMRPYKGLDLLLNAMATTKDANIRLIVAGRGETEYRIEHERLASNLGLNDRVEFRWGPVPNHEVNSLMENVDVVLFPYRHIYQSGALMLAFSFGKPVIVSRIKGFEEDVRDHINGMVAEVNNPAEFADAIDRLVSDGELMKSMGKQNKFLAETKYNWSDIALKTINFYKRVYNSA